MTDQQKPKRGFAAMSPELQRAIASKGGWASGGNFANNRTRAAICGKVGGSASSRKLENAD